MQAKGEEFVPEAEAVRVKVFAPVTVMIPVVAVIPVPESSVKLIED